jgi:hypothetical protein
LAAALDPARASPPANEPAPKRVGDAWTDPANPVVQRFKGDRLHLWSLKKPVRPKLPEVRHKGWSRNSIDHFILARQEKLKLAPSAEADRRMLIRRLSFDLLGLPPTPEEVKGFVEDPAPDAYERLVERLLASQHYGERWGRHWLDVVRYADTNGFERDEFRPTSWRYRDYVIHAFNTDKHYDQFIREQLAGDELALKDPKGPNAEKLIATGYLRLGPFDSTAPLFVEDKRGRDYLMADLVSTTGSAFLGLTLACCQCHDHKYDPLLQADHFRLRAFFAAVKYRDDLPLGSAKGGAQAKTQYAAVDAQMAAYQKEVDSLLKPVLERVTAARRTALLTASVPMLVSGGQGLQPVVPNVLLQLIVESPSARDKDGLKLLPPEQLARLDGPFKWLVLLKALKDSSATAMAMVDAGPNAPPTHLFAQGDINRPLGEVAPGFLSVLDPNPAEIPSTPSGRTTGRRTVLANWIASKENPLTARVLVNRLWQHHFGQGIVASPNDFGFSGTPPTNPDLLDWLAVEFMESGWSIKHMHRLMLQSATYRQVSAVDPRRQPLDPDNRTFWHQNIHRLEAETLRDAELAVSGKLQPKTGGLPVWPEVPVEALLGNPVIFESAADMENRLEWWYTDPPEKTDVRTVFTIQKRSVILPMLQVFDLPDPVISCGRRHQSTVAPQALSLLNSSFGVRMARAFAARVVKEAGADPTKQVDRAFRLALSRQPDQDEEKKLVAMLRHHRELHQRQDKSTVSPEQAALVDLCRVLLNLNEFMYID